MLSRSERETIIDRTADEDHWTVYTCERAMKRRLERLAREHGLTVRRTDEYGIEVDVPVGWVVVRRPRCVSEKEREQRRLRARERWSRARNLRPLHVSGP